MIFVELSNYCYQGIDFFMQENFAAFFYSKSQDLRWQKVDIRMTDREWTRVWEFWTFLIRELNSPKEWARLRSMAS